MKLQKPLAARRPLRPPGGGRHEPASLTASRRRPSPAARPVRPRSPADLEEVERILARDAARAATPRVAAGGRSRPPLPRQAAAAGAAAADRPRLRPGRAGAPRPRRRRRDDPHGHAGPRRRPRRRHGAPARARRSTPSWGDQTSVLLGDYLFTHAFHLASTLDDAGACRLIGEATNRVCEGELCQGLQRGNLDLTEDEYFDIIDGKTAELTACCCRLGALYSGRRAGGRSSALARYGRCLGLAFQIADDLLDLVGEEQATGKSLGTDLEQQKLTLPLIHLLQASPERWRRRARQILRGAGQPQARGAAAVPAGGDGAGLRPAAGARVGRAGAAELACLPPSPCRTILEAMTERVVHRDS